MSRPTVREAIRSLQAMNILESRHGAGTFVASLSVDELLRPLQFVLSLAEGGLDHLFEVRLLLEPGAAALAAERASDEQVAALRDCAARAEAEAVADADAMLRLDIELHERIVEASAQPAAPAPVGGDERARRREPLLHRAAAGRAARARSPSTARSSRRSRRATRRRPKRRWPRTSRGSGTPRSRGVPDLLLAGGTVVDGTGAPPRRADVAIADGRIAAVGEGLHGDEVIDVTGLVVAPGVVDIHSHADFTLLVDGRAQSSVLQGITTVAVGNCGHGLAPVEPHAVEAARMTTFCCRSEWEHAGTPSSFEAVHGALAAARPAVNVVPLVPHGSLRLNVAGFELRELTGREIDRLRGHGARGDGGRRRRALDRPGVRAGDRRDRADELRALCEPVGAHGGLYATHCRNREAGIVDAAREAAAVATSSGCRLQLSHFVRRLSSPADGGAVERAAREHALEAGARAGVAVGFDVFPFTFGPTPLTSLLPQAQRAGSRAEMAARLARAGSTIAGTRVAAVLEGAIGAEMHIASDGGRDRFVGRTLAEVAAELGSSVAAARYTLLADAGEDFYDVVVVERWAADDDLDRAVLDDDFCLMGDGVTGALDGPLAGLAFSLSDWGWVVRTLAHYVRDTGALALEAAIRRMTLDPARQLGLTDRGALLPGMAPTSRSSTSTASARASRRST